MTAHTIFNDTEEYTLRSIATLGCNTYSKITVALVILPKAVLSTVKIFVVCQQKKEILIQFFRGYVKS